MKTKHRLFFGFAVFVLAFALAGCSNPTGGGVDDGGGGLDSALVAKWYLYPTQVDDPGEDPGFEITASGRLISAANTNGEYNVTTSGGIISATLTLGGQTAEAGTANYTVSGNRLLFSNPIPTNSSVFLSFITALQVAETLDQFAGLLGADGYYHKIDLSNPFVGTWTGNGYTLTMTAATWEIDGSVKAKGIYTRDGNTATFTQTFEWSVGTWMSIALMGGQKPTYTVAISGTTVTVNYNGTTIPFTKETDAETPTISGQPQGATYTVGTAPTPLSVTANVTDGGILSYQWYRNTLDSTFGGTLITGETQPNYTPPSASAGTVYYYVIVTNTNNNVGGTKIKTATSNIVAITVNSGGGGGGGSSNPFEGTWTADDGGYTLTLIVTASDWELEGMKGTYDRNGNTATFTPTHYWTGTWTVIPSEYADPTTATISGTTMTWNDEKGPLSFTKEAIVNAATPTITGQPQSAMYTVGETATSLSVTANVTDGGTLSYRWYSSATPSASGGTFIGTQITCTPSTATVGMFYYYVVVTNTNNSVNGTTVMTATSSVAAITVAGAAAMPTITGQPQSATYTVGATASLSVTASGGNLSYQWYSSATPSASGGTPIGDATHTTYTWPTTAAGTFYYYVIVTNTNNNMTATSNVAAITVTGGGGGGSNLFEGTWVGTWTGGGVTLTATAALEWEEEGLPPAKVKGTYTYTGNTAILTPTHYWTGTWTVIPSEYADPTTVTVLGDKMTGTLGDNPFELTRNGGGGGGNSNAATPTISSPLQGATYTVGEMAALLFVIANAPDGGILSYQWYSNATSSTSGGTPISGATQMAYMPPTTSEGTVYYYVVVTNTNNSVSGTKTATATSNVVAITVIGGGGGGVPKTLVITDIPASVFDPETNGGLVGIFLTTTSEEDILLLLDKAAVAGADFANGDVRIDGNGPYTLSLPLYDMHDIRWTENGKYNAYIVLLNGSGARYFRGGSVTFSDVEPAPTIQFNLADEIILPPLPPK